MKVYSILITVIFVLFLGHYLLNVENNQRNKVDAEKYRTLEKFEVGGLQTFWEFNDEVDLLTPEISEEIAATMRLFAMDFVAAIGSARRSSDERWIVLYRLTIAGQFDAAAFLQRQLRGSLSRVGPKTKD